MTAGVDVIGGRKRNNVGDTFSLRWPGGKIANSMCGKARSSISLFGKTSAERAIKLPGKYSSLIQSSDQLTTCSSKGEKL